MKFLLLLLFLLFCTPAYAQTNAPDDEKIPVVIVSASWGRERQSSDKAVQSAVGPAPAMTKNNRNFERQKRVNDPAGMRDPNADTVDARASELERIVQQSREAEPVDGYLYQVRIHNVSPKLIQNIFWEYRFIEVGNAANVTQRPFLCGGEIKPERQKDLQIFSLVGPSEVVNVKSSGKDAGKTFRAAVIINRVEYSDGTYWERNGWSVGALKLRPDSRLRSADTVCRSL
ncbi:MAG TPA: hypothetical protein VK557_19720 [Pyrinomonadaceae bacterium]|nr:hypothetical protein [Pyrinomonadaceae bacterium]